METAVKLETPASSQPAEACWICELPASDLLDLTADRNAHLAEKLASLTKGALSREHRRSLCADCTAKLNDAYRFVQLCVEAERRLGGDPEVKVEQEEDHFVECMVEIKPEEGEEPLEGKLDGEQEDESAQSEGFSDEGEDSDFEVEEEPKRRGSRKNEPKSKTFQCETCDATFDVRKDLHQHIKTHGKRRFPCKLCDRIFVRKATLQDHMNKHEGVRKYNCDKCGKTFTQRANLIRHVKNIHLNEKGFPCSYCAKQFASKNNLEVHELTHITVKNFACEQCPRAFKTEALLKRHQIVQHFPEEQSGTAAAASDEKGAKNLPQSRVTDTRECEICHQELSSYAALRTHMLRHSEPVFMCSACGKRCTTKNLLKLHMRSHSDERPFACDVCPGKFKWEKTLQEHKLIHTKEKPFQCDICEKWFRTKTLLRSKIIRVVTGKSKKI
uniref:Zinc finger protein 26 n=1 Tax=Culex pipiens TaxID=7175 RepID=A0A8D8NP75_CULPI